MSREKFDDNCPGCKPVLIDPSTGRELPPTHPMMAAALAAWGETTLEERQGWHRFMCQNSRVPEDVMAARAVTSRMQHKMRNVPQ